MMGASQRTAMLVIGTALVAGLVGGAAFDRYVLLPRRVDAFRQQRNNRPSPEEMQKRFLDRMTKDLGLSETQRAGMAAVYQRQGAAMDSLQRLMRPVYDSVYKAGRAEVDSLLTPEQRTTLAELRKQRRNRAGGSGGPGGPGGGPGGGPRGGDTTRR